MFHPPGDGFFTHSDRKSRLITKYSPLWGDFEGGLDASEEREVAEMGVAYGKVIADGNAVMLEVFVEHRIHIVETVLRVFVFVKLAYDDTSDVFE